MYGSAIWLQQKPSPERGDRYEIGGAVINLEDQGVASRKFEWPTVGLKTIFQVVERNLESASAAETLAHIEAGTVGRCILPFIPLMQSGDESGIMKQWKRLAKAEPDEYKRSDYGAIAQVLAEIPKRQQAWKQALKGWNMMLSKQVLEWQAEARMEGKVEGQAETILRVLTAQFKTVPPVRDKLLAEQDPEVLANYAAFAGTAKSLRDFCY